MDSWPPALSNAWQQQGDTRPENGNVRVDYVWRAAIVEMTLNNMTELWELRDTEVHRKEENHKQKVRKDQISKTVRELH